MRISCRTKKITFTGVSNEAQMECITFPADRCKLKTTFEKNMTKVILTGTEKQIGSFIADYNS